MKAILVYPKNPLSTWGMEEAVKLVGCKANMPPLGLLTVAAMFPDNWELRFVDLNVSDLSIRDLKWADYVSISVMVTQSASLVEVASRTKESGVPVIVGGPITRSLNAIPKNVDHIVQGEVDAGFMNQFLDSLAKGVADPFYHDRGKTDITKVPIPRWDLMSFKDYRSIQILFSWGCPNACSFCEFGKTNVRSKTAKQLMGELEILYKLGWRKSVFIPDDNFIGAGRKVLIPILRDIVSWQKAKNYPFSFYTEAGINLAQDEELLKTMAKAGFFMVFIGLESLSVDALKWIKKQHNIQVGDIPAAIRKIQSAGLEVTLSFIVGLDDDDEYQFDRIYKLVQSVGVTNFLVGRLVVIPGTDLWNRLEKEGRIPLELCDQPYLNFKTQLDREFLIRGFDDLMKMLWSINMESYFTRAKVLIKNLGQVRRGKNLNCALSYIVNNLRDVKALWRSFFLQAFSSHGKAYLRFMFWCLFGHPGKFNKACYIAIQGYHLSKLNTPDSGRGRFGY